MVSSLRELAQQQVVTNLKEGLNLPFQLPSEISDPIFQTIVSESHVLPALNLDNLLLKVVNLGSSIVSDVFVKSIQRQNHVEKLMLSSAHFSQTYYIDNSREWKIIECLKDLTNVSSRKLLRYLDIGNTVRTSEHWENLVGELFPNLETLVIQYEYMDKFEPEFKYFQNLKFLDLNSTECESYGKVSELRNLEILEMREVILKRGEVDFGKLQKLKVLDISHVRPTPGTRNFEYLLENLKSSRTTLPNLQILECKFLDITLPQFEEILEFLPSLKIISLIGTSLNDIDFSHHKVKVLNCGTLDSSLECLKWKSSTEIWYRENLIVLTSVTDKMTIENWSAIREHLERICDILVVNDVFPDIVVIASRLLMFLCCSPQAGSLELSETVYIFKSYQPQMEVDDYYSHTYLDVEYHVNFWIMLSHPKFPSKTFEWGVDELIDLGKRIVLARVPAFNGREVLVIRVFQKILDHYSEDHDIVNVLADIHLRFKRENPNVTRFPEFYEMEMTLHDSYLLDYDEWPIE